MSSATAPQSRDFTPGDYVQGDYVTYRHQYDENGEIVQLPELEEPQQPILGASTGGRKRRVPRKERPLLLQPQANIEQRQPEKQERKPSEPKLHVIQKTFVAVYNIESLSDSLRSILQQQEEIDKLIEQLNRSNLDFAVPVMPPINIKPKLDVQQQERRTKVSKTFTAIYHRYALVEKSATALYQKRQLVSKSFTGLYDIKAPDYDYLNRLKRARAFSQLIDVLDPES